MAKLKVFVAVLLLGSAWPAQAGKIVISDFFGAFGTRLDNFYDAAGHNSTLLGAAAASAADLVGADLHVLYLPNPAYSPAQVAVLQDYLAGGGRLAIFADNWVAATPQNDNINAILSALGASMSINPNPAFIDSGFHLATKANGQIQIHPLTDGVDALEYAAPSTLITGVADIIFTGQDLPLPWAGFQSLGGGSLFLSGDSNVTDRIDGVNDNDVFFLNLVEVGQQVPEPRLILLLGAGLTAMGWFRMRRSTRS
jgi:hypothetical protein